MKGKKLFSAILLTVMALMFLFAACDSNTSKITDATYTVTFVTNGGNAIDPVTVNDGETIDPATPTRTNFHFDGWFTDEGCTDPFDENEPIGKNMTLYAKWTRTGYSVTLILPENEQVTLTVEVNGTLDLGTIDEYDIYAYECTGWSDGTATYLPDEVITVDKDITLTGQFTFLEYHYELDDSGEFYIIFGYNGTAEEVTVPAQYKDLPVKEIYHMGDAGTITKLTVPDTITAIGAHAFGDLSSLETLDVPYLGNCKAEYENFNGGNYSFGYWFYDTEMYPNGMNNSYYGKLRNYWMNNAHYDPQPEDDSSTNSTSYHDVFIPRTLKSVTVRGGAIMDYAFSNMAMLKEVNIGDSITHIAANAFYCDLNADNVTKEDGYRAELEVKFGTNSQLEFLGYGAFDGNVSLVKIAVPKGVAKLQGSTFSGCSNLTDVTFADDTNMSEFGDREFYMDSNNDAAPVLTHIELPETLEKIGTFVFSNQTSLEEIVIPAKVNSIGVAMFYNCNNLVSAEFAAGSAITAIPTRFFERCFKLSSLTLPETVSEIGESAFNNCAELSEFDFSKIEKFGDGAFNACKFASVTVPACTTEFGASVFANNDKLVSATFECTLETLKAVFDDCDSLTTIKFPNNIKTIDEATFRNCKSLTSIEIPATVTSIGNVAFSGINIALNSLTFAANSKLESIGTQAFSRQSDLTEINLPATLKTIGREAFAFCSNISKVTFAENSLLETIDYGAFRRMTSLASFEIPDKVQTIGEIAFENDQLLSEITIPESVNAIGANAFNDCGDLLITLEIDAAAYAQKQWATDWYGDSKYSLAGDDTEVDLANGFKGLVFDDNNTAYVLQYTGADENLTLTDKVSYNNKEYTAIYHGGLFKGNTTLKTVTLPETMTDIPDNFFDGCTALTTVTTTAKIKNIGHYAFNGCTNFTTFDGEFTELVTIGDYAFNNCQKFVKEFEVAKTITKIGNRAFYYCKALTIKFNDDSTEAMNEIGSYAFYHVPVVANNTDKILRLSVKKIGDHAFYMSRPEISGTPVVAENAVHAVIIDGADYIGAQAFSTMSYTGGGGINKRTYTINYFIIKGEPSYIGNGFAEGNFSSDKHSFKSRIYFEDMTFSQEILVGGYLGDFKVVLPWGKVSSDEEKVKSWGKQWYYYDCDDEAEDPDLYMPVFGKNEWQYDNSKVPTYVNREKHYGTYKGTDQTYNDYGDFTLTISAEGVKIVYDTNEETLDITIVFAFNGGYMLDYDGSTLYIFFLFDADGNITAGVLAANYYFNDEYHDDEYSDAFRVYFYPDKESDAAGSTTE